MTTPGTLLRDAAALLAVGMLVAAWSGGLGASLGFAASGALTVANLVAITVVVKKLLSGAAPMWVVPVLIGKTALIALFVGWLLTVFPVAAVLSGFGVGLFAITLRGVSGLSTPALAEGEA